MLCLMCYKCRETPSEVLLRLRGYHSIMHRGTQRCRCCTKKYIGYHHKSRVVPQNPECTGACVGSARHVRIYFLATVLATRSRRASSSISPGSVACNSTEMPSRKPRKKSLVDACCIFAFVAATSGALRNSQRIQFSSCTSWFTP